MVSDSVIYAAGGAATVWLSGTMREWSTEGEAVRAITNWDRPVLRQAPGQIVVNGPVAGAPIPAMQPLVQDAGLVIDEVERLKLGTVERVSAHPPRPVA